MPSNFCQEHGWCAEGCTECVVCMADCCMVYIRLFNFGRRWTLQMQGSMQSVAVKAAGVLLAGETSAGLLSCPSASLSRCSRVMTFEGQHVHRLGYMNSVLPDLLVLCRTCTCFCPLPTLPILAPATWDDTRRQERCALCCSHERAACGFSRCSVGAHELACVRVCERLIGQSAGLMLCPPYHAIMG